jgi:four helix bundle protein
MAVSDYKELIAWQRAMDLVVDVYQLTQCFPVDERFGLTNQLRRAAVSIPSNIAEGQGRGLTRDFQHFVGISNGSRQEVETQLLIAARLGFANEQHVFGLLQRIEELGRILSGLKASVS